MILLQVFFLRNGINNIFLKKIKLNFISVLIKLISFDPKKLILTKSIYI
jgi:hypothetical protein